MSLRLESMSRSSLLDSMFPSLSLNNKAIFFVVVDIFERGVPASKQGVLRSVYISEKELVQSVEPQGDSAVASAGEASKTVRLRLATVVDHDAYSPKGRRP